MKRKKTKIFLKISAFILCTFFTAFIGLCALFLVTTKDTFLDTSKFVKAISNKIEIYDRNNNKVDTSEIFNSNGYVKLTDLPAYTPAAFIATEDKRFYKHHGIDAKRMISAGINNIKNKKFSQGASTITQQLIKNTHLSQEKTMTRKMKEIKLAYSLENTLSKDEILEQYLNTIYFGNGAYGIENASKTYFGKSAKNLTIGESAMLAGIIKAPTYYDPIHKNKASEKRKKTVLKLMQNQGYISEEDCEKNAKTTENIVKNTSKTAKTYNKLLIYEICNALKVNENQLKNMNITIKTSADLALCETLSSLLKNSKYSLNGESNNPLSSAVIILDNNDKSILAIASENAPQILKTKRQPGSTIKPIIAFAPAIEYNIITPESMIKDEPININGYSPSNANKKYAGDVTVKESLQKSLNIPTIKILSYVGINKAKNFSEKLGISFTSQDQNLALALGGMTEGVTLKQIADAYSCFATGGTYTSSNMIDSITDKDNNTLWQKNNSQQKVMKDSTAFLITDMLLGTSQNGTTRRLANMDYQFASKTGTVGITGNNSNTDAYCVAYTSQHTIVTWFGENEKSGHMPASINGSTYPTILMKDVLNLLYDDSLPSDFDIPSSVEKHSIDTRSQLTNNKIELVKQNTPERYKKEAYFAKDNLPKQSSFDKPHNTSLKVIMNEGQKPTFTFETKNDNIYSLVREDLTSNTSYIVKTWTGDGKPVKFQDTSTTTAHIYQYCVEVVNVNNQKEYFVSNKIKLLSY